MPNSDYTELPFCAFVAYTCCTVRRLSSLDYASLAHNRCILTICDCTKLHCVDSITRTSWCASLDATTSSFAWVSCDICAKCAHNVSSIIERICALSSLAAHACCKDTCAVDYMCPANCDVTPSCAPKSPVACESYNCNTAIEGSIPFFLHIGRFCRLLPQYRPLGVQRLASRR